MHLPGLLGIAKDMAPIIACSFCWYWVGRLRGREEGWRQMAVELDEEFKRHL
jgi:hypothetical protein